MAYQNVYQNIGFCLLKCFFAKNILSCFNVLWYFKLHHLILITTLEIGGGGVIPISGEETNAQ